MLVLGAVDSGIHRGVNSSLLYSKIIVVYESNGQQSRMWIMNLFRILVVETCLFVG